MIEYECPHCSLALKIPPQYAGQKGRCNRCGNEIMVPAVASPQTSQHVASQERANSYGGFWLRFLAYWLDCLVLYAPVSLLVLLLGDLLSEAFRPVLLDSMPPQEVDTLLPYIAEGIGQWVLLLLAVPYFVVLESSKWRATPAKLVLGLQVIGEDGATISAWRAAGRFFGKMLSLLPLGIGFLMVGFTQKKQGLHDKVSDTLVVRRTLPIYTRVASGGVILAAAFLVLFGERLLLGVPGPVDIAAETPLDGIVGADSTLTFVSKMLGNVSLDGFLSHLTDDQVFWAEYDLEQGSAYRETHDLVAAEFKGWNSIPTRVFFLVERDGGRVLPDKAHIGDEKIDCGEYLVATATALGARLEAERQEAKKAAQ